MDMIWLVGNTAIFCTVASNLAGLPICLECLKKKSTTGVSFLPFLAAATCCSLWLQYGIAVGDTVLAVVNIISVTIQACYLACFYYSTVSKSDVMKSSMIAAILLALIYAYVFHVTDTGTGYIVLGYFAAASSIISSATPMTAIGKVIESGSTEGLPFPIIFAGFIVNTLWYTYGALIADTFVKVPSLIGASLSGFQLSLFVIYNSGSITKENAKKRASSSIDAKEKSDLCK